MVGLIDVRFCNGAAVLEIGETKMMPLRWSAAYFVIEDMDALGSGYLLQELLALGVVGGLNCLFVSKGFLATLMMAILEACGVERVLVFVAINVGNGKVVCKMGSLVCDSALSDDYGSWWRAISRVVPVVQSRCNIVLLSMVAIGDWWFLFHRESVLAMLRTNGIRPCVWEKVKPQNDADEAISAYA